MFEKLQAQAARAYITHTVLKTAGQGKGMAVQVWPLGDVDRDHLAGEIVDWVAGKLPGTANPHGLAAYGVTLMWVRMDGDQRTWLGDQSMRPFKRLDALDALEHLPTAVVQLLLPPDATHLEVYLLSFGDLVKPAFDALG